MPGCCGWRWSPPARTSGSSTLLSTSSIAAPSGWSLLTPCTLQLFEHILPTATFWAYTTNLYAIVVSRWVLWWWHNQRFQRLQVATTSMQMLLYECVLFWRSFSSTEFELWGKNTETENWWVAYVHLYFLCGFCWVIPIGAIIYLNFLYFLFLTMLAWPQITWDRTFDSYSIVCDLSNNESIERLRRWIHCFDHFGMISDQVQCLLAILGMKQAIFALTCTICLLWMQTERHWRLKGKIIRAKKSIWINMFLQRNMTCRA